MTDIADDREWLAERTRTALRLPDFLILGAPKAGTTSLARWLEEHPDVFVPPAKELRFFDNDGNWPRGLEWYADFFADAATQTLVGEATPTYLARPDAAERIASVLPQAKLIVSLRHPVDRAYSHYWHARDWGGEKRSFEDVCAAPLRGAEDVRRYLSLGYYYEHLVSYERLFPPESLLALRFEAIADDPVGTFARVCRFLGVPETPPANLGRVYNAHSRHRSTRLRTAMLATRLWRRAPRAARLLDRVNTVERAYPPLDPTLRQRLLEHFAPHNDRLAAHLGQDLSAWSR